MPTTPAEPEPFAPARNGFDEMCCWLEGTESAALSHAELEDQVERRGRELQRLMLQNHLDLRALREQRVRPVDATGVTHANVEPGHSRQLATVVGAVRVSRLAYRHPGTSNLHPADGALNLPAEMHSHGLRRLAAIESSRGSFEDASEAIERSTGVTVAKRQVESLTAAAAADVEGFYAARAPEPGTSKDVVVISVDGKGIVMRPDALRPATANAAGVATAKLGSRLSKGELCASSHNSPYAQSALIRSSAVRVRVPAGEGGARLPPLRIIAAGLIDAAQPPAMGAGGRRSRCRIDPLSPLDLSRHCARGSRQS